jgi:hypothetical protein
MLESQLQLWVFLGKDCTIVTIGLMVKSLRDFRNVWKCITNKTQKYLIYISLERHTLFLRSHSWQYMSEPEPSHEVEGIVHRALRQHCVEAQIWGRVPKIVCSIEGPQEQWPPSFLNRRSLEPPRLFLELASRPNWTIWGERPWSGRWPRTRWSLWQSSRVPLWRWENLPEGQPSLQHSTNQAFMVERPDRSHSSVKDTWHHTWSLPKGT